jgi:DNA topoisomerase I
MPKKIKETWMQENQKPILFNVEDIKQITSIPVKTKTLDEIETVEKMNTKSNKKTLKTKKVKKKPTRKKTAKKKTIKKKTTRKKIKKIQESFPIGIKEKSDIEDKTKNTNKKSDNILIITEKPQAAQKIAYSLGNAKKIVENSVPYYELTRNNKKITVSCAVGHLFSLDSEEKSWPCFDVRWVYADKRNKWTKKYINVLKKLVKNSSEFISATDYDIEGEVIGLNVIRFIAKQGDAKRMKFSSLTKNEIEKSYNNLMPSLNWGHAIAGETRHILDWLYGINLSRALMSAIKTTGKFKILSIGRVQGPALNLIVQKEKEILDFKPEPYWQVLIKLKGHSKVSLKYIKNIFEEKDLKKFENLKGEDGIAETQKKSHKLPPLPPFDLTSLQRESYRLFGINPAKTLQIAQSLYLNGLISYPRTSSQKIPTETPCAEILDKLSKHFKEVKFVTKNKPLEGKKSDPAHPAIIPTGEYQKLSLEEEKIYNLIVKRFINCFCDFALVEDKIIAFITEKEKLKFKTKGSEIKEKGWLEVYPFKIKEDFLEDINGKKKISSLKIEEKQTLPPKRYTPASLVTELEKRNLGTKATRSNIIETLYDRGYAKGQSIEATPLGINLISTLEKHSPVIIDEKLTRRFEKQTESITQAKKNLTNLQDIVFKEAKKTIIKISDDFKKNEIEIGKDLIKAVEKNYEKERQENTLGKCHTCNEGNLIILYNRKARRQFVACSAYPKCRQTYSLPPNGLVKPSLIKDENARTSDEKINEKCEKCGFPLVISFRKGKKPWKFCFNPECETNKEWKEKRDAYIQAHPEIYNNNEEK